MSRVAPADLSVSAGAGAREQTRAAWPEDEGFVERDGVRVFYETYGSGEPAVLLLPTWSIVHSRVWKGQIAHLARRCRVITFDGRGNGRSDRPAGTRAYAIGEFVADALAVLDATSTPRAHLVGLSCGALWGTVLAADHSDRVESIAYIAPAVGLVAGHPGREVYPFDEPPGTDAGWAQHTSSYWSSHYEEFLEFFFAQCFSEAHSTKQIEDGVGWGLETTARTLAETTRGISSGWNEPFRDLCARVRCPSLVIHGDQDRIRPHAQGAALAEATGGRLVTLEGAGHLPTGRDPVKINRLLEEFICPAPPARTWTRAAARPKRALFVSSPIGLGHARRDLAIAGELRALHPGLEIDWLAQHPVTTVLEAHGERIHPASAQLAGESAHMEAEAEGHALHCFQALRRMDEILIANFMVFSDVVRDKQYDLWIGDEAWDVDYHLHENPELKTAPYAWLTDFVGWLPVAAGGEREAALTADLNAEMIEQLARHPRVRDRSIFVGEPADIVPGTFGPGLPEIRAWTEAHYTFAGQITGFDPAELGDRATLRHALGYAPGDKVCVVAVGGSGVGEGLLRRVIAAFPEARAMVPALRMIVVAGPRIDPTTLPTVDGVEVHGWIADLHRHLAACDLALVQGGLTTGMELVAAGRPFIAFPLELHFEQNLHVRHRLERHGAHRRMVFAEASPSAIAAVIATEIGRKVDYLAVGGDGAARAAAFIGELL